MAAHAAGPADDATCGRARAPKRSGCMRLVELRAGVGSPDTEGRQRSHGSSARRRQKRLT
jgi:hypothetical protein